MLTREQVLDYCEQCGSICEWIKRIPLARELANHDAAQRTTIEERDATIATLTARVEELESQHIQQASIIQILNRSDLSKSIEICIQTRDFILQQFCNLQIMYGEQKHKLRELEAELAKGREGEVEP